MKPSSEDMIIFYFYTLLLNEENCDSIFKRQSNNFFIFNRDLIQVVGYVTKNIDIKWLRIKISLKERTFKLNI